jgi:MFS family permease
MLVFAPIAGDLAERSESHRLIVRIKAIEIVLMAIAAVGFLLNEGWLLIVTLFAMAAQSAFFSPARQNALRKYMRAEELVRANGLSNAGLYGSIVAGLFCGGLLIVGAGGRETVAAWLFGAALAGWLSSLATPHAAPNAPGLKLTLNPLAGAASLLQRAFSARGLARPILGWALFFYVSTVLTVSIPIYARQSLNADEFAATSIMGAIGIGAGLGGLFAAMLSRGRSGLNVSGAGIAAGAALTAAIFWLTPQAAAAIARGGSLLSSAEGRTLLTLFLLAAIALGLFVAPLQAAIQRRAPEAECARLLAAGNMLNAAAAMVGSLTVFVIGRLRLDPGAVLAFVALLLAAIALYMARRKQTTPPGLFDEALAASIGAPSAGEKSGENPGQTRVQESVDNPMELLGEKPDAGSLPGVAER